MPSQQSGGTGRPGTAQRTPLQAHQGPQREGLRVAQATVVVRTTAPARLPTGTRTDGLGDPNAAARRTGTARRAGWRETTMTVLAAFADTAGNQGGVPGASAVATAVRRHQQAVRTM